MSPGWRGDGHDTAIARQLLSNFEEMQRMRVADRDRIAIELAAAQK